MRYVKYNDISTILYFYKNVSVKVGCKYNLIDNQVVRCIKLENILLKRINFEKKECMIFEDHIFQEE